MGEKITDLYLLRKERTRREELDAWMASKLAEVEKQAKEPPPPKIGTPGFLGWAEEKSGLRMGSPDFIDWLKKEGYTDPGTAEHVDINIFRPSVEDLFGVILNPGEWPSMFAGGAWGAYRTGLPILKTGIDWTLFGLPSLGKGIIGFGKGIRAGLSAPSLERPLKEGVETITDVVSRIPGMRAAGEIAPTGMAAAVREMETGATALADKIETAGATLSDFEFTGKLFRSGKIDANPEGTYYALTEEGAKMYKKLLGGGPVNAYELPPVRNTLVLDIDENLPMIEKYAGKTLDDVGDISVLLEDALPGIKEAGYDSAVVVGELGPETWGPPIEFIDLRPMAERMSIEPSVVATITNKATYQGIRKTALMGPNDEMLVAAGKGGKDIGFLWLTKEESGFSVRDVVVEGTSRRQGVATKLYEEANRLYGRHLGSTAQTSSGKALIRSLREKSPWIFEGIPSTIRTMRSSLGKIFRKTNLVYDEPRTGGFGIWAEDVVDQINKGEVTEIPVFHGWEKKHGPTWGIDKEFGTHFADDIDVAKGFGDNVTYARIRPKKALLMDDIMDHTNAGNVAEGLIDAGVLSKEYLTDRFIKTTEGSAAGNLKELRKLQKIVKGKGYDVIAYNNAYEDGVGIIVLDKNTIVSESAALGELGGTKPELLGVPTAEQLAEHRAATLGSRVAEERRYVPALQGNKGTIIQGGRGEAHFQLIDRMPQDEKVMLSGWMDETGKFVTDTESAAQRAESVSAHIQERITDVNTKLKNLATNWEKIVEKQRRGIIPHEEAREMGKAMGWGLDDIRKLFPGTPMNAEQASHLVDTIKPIADDSVRAAHRYIKTRSPEDMHEALYKFSALMEVDPKRLGVLAEAGRTLSQLNEPISGVNQYLDQFAKAFSELGPEGITPEILVQMLSKFQTPEQLAIMARHVAKPGSVKAWAEAVMEGWIMGLLTGPRTHLVNFTSNCLTAVLGPTERALAARLAFGEGKHVVKGEATEMVYGMIEGFMDGLSLAAKTWRTGVSHFGAEKAEYIGKKAISAEALNLSGTFGRAVDVLGEAVRAPGRALIAADDIWKTVNFRANMRALALREGRAQGLERNTMEMAGFIEDFLKAPPVRAVQASRGFANYMTFTKELDGLAFTAQRVLEHHPFLRVIVPFWRTPVNIFKFSLERTPLLNALSGQIRRDIMAGGVRRDMALGKIALSSMVAATIYTLARAGYITGSGPENKNLKEICKEAGRQRDSIRVGKNFYSYSRVDPLSIMIGAMADLAEVSDYLDAPKIHQYAMALVLGFSEHSVSKTYLTGLSNVIDALKEPDKQAIDYMESWTRSLVPTAMRHVAYQIDPIMRETIGVFDNIIAGTPWGSKTLPPKRNLKGEPEISEGSLGPDMFSFVFQSTMKDDPVWKELIDNKVSISPVARHMGGPRPPRGVMGQETIMHGVELTAPEYDWVCRMAGNEMKVDGMGMWDKLQWLIKTPQYQNATPGPYGSKALMIKAIVNAYRDLAFAKLRQASPKLDEALRQKEISRGEEMIP